MKIKIKKFHTKIYGPRTWTFNQKLSPPTPPTFEQIKLEKPSYPIPEIPDSPKRKAVLENPSKSALPPPKRQSLGGLATNPNKTPASASVPVTSADSGLGSDTTSKKREYICDFCGKRFGKRWDVERHRRYIHTGERPYICNVCKTCEIFGKL